MARCSRLLMLALALLLGGCESDDEGPEEELFPRDFEGEWTEMRSCRHSHEHELRFIRVFASESAVVPYATLSAEEPYPADATLLKVEYDDDACETTLGFTVMKKLGKGENPEGFDWRWQKLDAERVVMDDGAPPRCINCHSEHCAPPHGFDLSCAEEI